MKNSYCVLNKLTVLNKCAAVCRAWVEYKQGFGDLYSPDGEFWLGNEPIHHLTSQGVCACVSTSMGYDLWEIFNT